MTKSNLTARNLSVQPVYLLHMILDAYYFGRLEGEYSLIHVSAHTINAMAAFLFFGL